MSKLVKWLGLIAWWLGWAGWAWGDPPDRPDVPTWTVSQMIDPLSVPQGAGVEYFADSPGLVGAPGQTATLDGFGTLRSQNVGLCFFVGLECSPLRLGQKSLEGGHLPILSASAVQDSIFWNLECFASEVQSDPGPLRVQFVRISARNDSRTPERALLSAACSGSLLQKSQAFSPLVSYRAEGRRSIREKNVICIASPEGNLTAAKDVPYAGPFQARDVYALRNTPVLWRRFDSLLRPGETATMEFIVPSDPISASDHLSLAAMEMAVPLAYREREIARWNRFLLAGATMSLGEQTVVDAQRANLITSLLFESHSDQEAFRSSTLGEPLLSCLGAKALDVWGHHDEARPILQSLVEGQWPSSGQIGGDDLAQCQIVWALCAHLKMTRDVGLAKFVFPQCRSSLEGMASRLDILSREEAAWLGRSTSDAADLADFLLNPDQARAWADLSQRSKARMAAIPFDPNSSWEGLMPVFLGMEDARRDEVGLWLDECQRAHMAEGCLVKEEGTLLPALTNFLGEVRLARGEDELAVQCLYASLCHTSSTWAGPDEGPSAWGERWCADPPPHAAFSHLLSLFLRDMWIREDEESLHLLSGVSPEWLQPGRSVSLMNMPTLFGPIHLNIDVTNDGARMALDTAFNAGPSQIVVHLPWFVRVKSAHCDGKSMDVEHRELALKPASHSLVFRWDWLPSKLNLSRAREEIQSEYSRRFKAYVAQGREPFVLAVPWPEDEKGRRQTFESMWPAERENLALPRRTWSSPGFRWGSTDQAAISGAEEVTGSQWLVAELDAPALIEGVRIFFPGLNAGLIACRVDLSEDGRAWQPASSHPETVYGMSGQMVFPGQRAQYVRLTFESASQTDLVEVVDVQFVRANEERGIPLDRNVALTKEAKDEGGRDVPWMTDGLISDLPDLDAEFPRIVTVDLERGRPLVGVGAWRVDSKAEAFCAVEASSDGVAWQSLGGLVFKSSQRVATASLPTSLARYLRWTLPDEGEPLTEVEAYLPADIERDGPESQKEDGG